MVVLQSLGGEEIRNHRRSPVSRRFVLTTFLCSFMGGNSTKATSGINGAGTQSQQDLNIPDSAKLFFEDTKRSVRSSRFHLGMTY